MRNSAFFVAGLLLLLLQANLFRVLHWVPIPGLTPSLVLPLILFMGVHEYSLARGALVSFALGYGTDLIGVAPVGLYTFSYVALFVLARTVGVRLAAQTRTMQMAMATGFTLVHTTMVLVLIAIFGRDAYVPKALVPMIFPHVVSTALASPFIFAFAKRLHAIACNSSPLRGGLG